MRTAELAALGRRVAASQGPVFDRPDGDWIAYGQACHDALVRGRPLPLMHPPTAPPEARTAPVRAPTLPARRARPSFASRLAWGLAWRYGIFVSLLVVAEVDPQKPWTAIVAVLAAGLFLGLWCRRSAIGRVWRTAVVAGGAIFVAPLLSIYPDVLAGSLGALTIAPLVAAWRG